MTWACPFPGCRALVFSGQGITEQTYCWQHRGLEAPAETEEKRMDRIRAEMGWKKPWGSSPKPAGPAWTR